MKIYKTTAGNIIEHEGNPYLSTITNWDELINQKDLFPFLKEHIQQVKIITDKDWLHKQKVLAPIGTQEVWAAGVTYLRSKVARMEESEQSGGATFYDKVYDAERPELFFKATAQRTVGTNDYVRIRKDSTWDVPDSFHQVSSKLFAPIIARPALNPINPKMTVAMCRENNCCLSSIFGLKYFL